MMHSAQRKDRAIEAAVPTTSDYIWKNDSYAISGMLRGAARLAGIFFLNQTFARHLPKNGAAATMAKAKPKATRILTLLSSQGSFAPLRA
jgi:hypothetical protein